MSNDAELLQRYVRECDQSAFAELVRRHLPVVFAAACRRTHGRADLAEDVAQQVFCQLARKSRYLIHHTSLIGWLYRSTRYVAIDALRAESRRRKLIHHASTMAEPPPDEPALDWSRLGPVLDAAMDDLRERDREVVLMRYFSNLTFGEIGARLGVSENTARMRTERSLERLRAVLARRGIVSSAAVLTGALAHEACAQAPVGVAGAIAQAATALGPAPAVSGAMAAFLMGKYTLPAVSGLVAAGLAAVVWTAAHDGTEARDLEALRAENARLAAADPSGGAVTATVSSQDEYAAQAVAISRSMMEQRASRRAAAAGSVQTAVAGGRPSGPAEEAGVTARGHRNRGTATPHDAAMTFAWACDIADPVELARVVTFDPEVRLVAAEVLASLPEGIRAEYATPEDVFGMLLAASCLEAPPPGADLMETYMTLVEIAPGRYATRRAGSVANVHQYQQTAEGWKYVLPIEGVRGLPGILNSETLARLSERP